MTWCSRDETSTATTRTGRLAPPANTPRAAPRPAASARSGQRSRRRVTMRFSRRTSIRRLVGWVHLGTSARIVAQVPISSHLAVSISRNRRAGGVGVAGGGFEGPGGSGGSGGPEGPVSPEGGSSWRHDPAPQPEPLGDVVPRPPEHPFPVPPRPRVAEPLNRLPVVRVDPEVDQRTRRRAPWRVPGPQLRGHDLDGRVSDPLFCVEPVPYGYEPFAPVPDEPGCTFLARSHRLADDSLHGAVRVRNHGAFFSGRARIPIRRPASESAISCARRRARVSGFFALATQNVETLV